jgi:hypothetical protein
MSVNNFICPDSFIKKLFFSFFNFLFLIVLTCKLSVSQTYQVQYTKCFGAQSEEGHIDFISSLDGGFLGTGFYTSMQTDTGIVNNLCGGPGYCIIKMDEDFNYEWHRRYGGSGDDVRGKIRQNVAGHIYVGGTSTSNDGDVVGNHGSNDIWIIKLDTSGNLIWSKSYGGSSFDMFLNMNLTEDGGLVISGHSGSSDGDVGFHLGDPFEHDAWVFKIDSSGNILWSKVIATPSYDLSPFATEISNKRVIALVAQKAYPQTHESRILIFDSLGNVLQDSVMLFPGMGTFLIAAETTDGGFILGGAANHPMFNNPDDTIGYRDTLGFRGSDYLLFKTNATLEKEWSWVYGGNLSERLIDMKILADGGFLLIGETMSRDYYASDNIGNIATLCIRTFSTGKPIWYKCFGGSFNDYLKSIVLKNDEIILAGYGISEDGDFGHCHYPSGTNILTNDALISVIKEISNSVKENIKTNNSFHIYPNPFRNRLTIKNDNPIFQNISIQILDLNGKILFNEQQFDDGKIEIRVKSLSNQILIVRILNDNKLLHVQKLFSE